MTASVLFLVLWSYAAVTTGFLVGQWFNARHPELSVSWCACGWGSLPGKHTRRVCAFDDEGVDHV